MIVDAIEFIIALIGGGLVAGIAEIIRARSERRKIDFDREAARITAKQTAKQADVDRAFALIDELQQDNNRLRETLRVQDEHIQKVADYYRAKCEEYEQIIQSLRGEISELRRIIDTNGIDPVKKTRKGRYL